MRRYVVRRSAAAAVTCLGISLSLLAASQSPVRAAEPTTGTITGTVLDAQGHPVAKAVVTVSSVSHEATTTSDSAGRFVVPGLPPDTYTVSVHEPALGAALRQGVVVLAGSVVRISVQLARQPTTLATIRVQAPPYRPGSSTDSFLVVAPGSRAIAPPVSSSGLANYAAGTVQGAIAPVPGIVLDPFGNAILRGSQIDDAAFEYDSVPIPQGLVAEPGGNIAGAQLPTVGLGSTLVTLGGYESQSENALGGVVDEIPAQGGYPGSSSLSYGFGLTHAKYNRTDFDERAATSDLRFRYAVAATTSSEWFPYGDGVTFYPAEAATYGLSLQTRGQTWLETNMQLRTGRRDEVSFLALAGQAAYNQYGSPYAGETVGAFDGSVLHYPNGGNPNAPVTWASGLRGTIGLVKLGWSRASQTGFLRVQVYRSRYGSNAGGPFWDENGFPNGGFSLISTQYQADTGISADADRFVSDRHHLRYGGEYRVNTAYLHQIVPTFDEIVRSQPVLSTVMAYVGDAWTPGSRFSAMAALRFFHTHVVPSTGAPYDLAAMDPHVGLVYRLGADMALRLTGDHNTVAPKPLEADRFDSVNVGANGQPPPFQPLSPERGDDLGISLEGGGGFSYRIAGFAQWDRDRIDILPANFRAALGSETLPSGPGIPTNVGQLQVHGIEADLRAGHLTFDATYVHAISSSASQFALNFLNVPAAAAGHLFPQGYVPDFSATLGYDIALAAGRLRVVPSLAYESGYPYGVGRDVFVFDPVTHRPIQVLNDNYWNPGANYYFLRDPSQPYNPVTNPYIGSLGTPEGSDPNTLRAPAEAYLNLHIQADVTAHMSVELDAANLLGNAAPVAYQSNPYLIGPPGYRGGNPLYAAYYQTIVGGSSPYVLGNGVPTNDGMHQSVPWSYGTAGYVPQSYPFGRTVQLRLTFHM